MFLLLPADFGKIYACNRDATASLHDFLQMQQQFACVDVPFFV